jgi:hypothetical protein
MKKLLLLLILTTLSCSTDSEDWNCKCGMITKVTYLNFDGHEYTKVSIKNNCSGEETERTRLGHININTYICNY